mmetsp:Transcript_19623/g.27028  ORF Transcript_19623/g.27028 Transcript_19623/m.27028 type:complete len:361 (-) Transcript_19623:169-1251(-)
MPQRQNHIGDLALPRMNPTEPLSCCRSLPLKSRPPFDFLSDPSRKPPPKAGFKRNRIDPNAFSSRKKPFFASSPSSLQIPSSFSSLLAQKTSSLPFDVCQPTPPLEQVPLEVVEVVEVGCSNKSVEANRECDSEEVSSSSVLWTCENYKSELIDAYKFISKLPPLAPRIGNPLLPPQSKKGRPTLLLDLDETLVHSSQRPLDNPDFIFPIHFENSVFQIFTKKRPHLDQFLRNVCLWYEVVIFTASQEIYAGRILELLDPSAQLFSHCLFRDSCLFIEGNYLKELSLLGRDISRTVIVDNSPAAFGYQIDNGVPIESWFENKDDHGLLDLLPFLETLSKVNDVCPLIRKRFSLRSFLSKC